MDELTFRIKNSDLVGDITFTDCIFSCTEGVSYSSSFAMLELEQAWDPIAQRYAGEILFERLNFEQSNPFLRDWDVLTLDMIGTSNVIINNSRISNTALFAFFHAYNITIANTAFNDSGATFVNTSPVLLSSLNITGSPIADMTTATSETFFMFYESHNRSRHSATVKIEHSTFKNIQNTRSSWESYYEGGAILIPPSYQPDRHFSKFEVYNCSFSNISEGIYAIKNMDDKQAIDARLTWWGGPAGPRDVRGCNTIRGRKTVRLYWNRESWTSHVLYHPWCYNESCTSTGTPPFYNNAGCLTHAGTQRVAIICSLVGAALLVAIACIILCVRYKKRRKAEEEERLAKSIAEAGERLAKSIAEAEERLAEAEHRHAEEVEFERRRLWKEFMERTTSKSRYDIAALTNLSELDIPFIEWDELDVDERILRTGAHGLVRCTPIPEKHVGKLIKEPIPGVVKMPKMPLSPQRRVSADAPATLDELPASSNPSEAATPAPSHSNRSDPSSSAPFAATATSSANDPVTTNNPSSAAPSSSLAPPFAASSSASKASNDPSSSSSAPRRQISNGPSPPPEHHFDLKFEAYLLHSLAHPHLVPFFGYTYCGDDHTVGLVMQQMRDFEFVAGERFDYYLSIVSQLASVMAHLASHRVAHGDLKPGNLLFYPSSNQIALSDFGYSQYIPHGTTCVKTEFYGTTGYDAPEAKSDHCISEASDVFSFGASVYEIYTGKSPLKIDLEDQLLPESMRKLISLCMLKASERPTFADICQFLRTVMPPPTSNPGNNEITGNFTTSDEPDLLETDPLLAVPARRFPSA